MSAPALGADGPRVRVRTMVEGVRIGLGSFNGGELAFCPAAQLAELIRAGFVRIAQSAVRVRAMVGLNHGGRSMNAGDEFTVFPEALLGLLDARVVEIADQRGHA